MMPGKPRRTLCRATHFSEVGNGLMWLDIPALGEPGRGIALSTDCLPPEIIRSIAAGNRYFLARVNLDAEQTADVRLLPPFEVAPGLYPEEQL